jgi:pimeloyl-ACP methyl ester carboxylesterase
MRIIYLPGLGETPGIFEKIAAHIESDESVFPDHFELLGNEPKSKFNALQYATELIAKYHINGNDVIIGHSMGGWIAYHIKLLVNSPIVQIAAWTNPDRVILPISNRRIIYFLARSGLYLNRFTLKHFIKRDYKGKPSAGIYTEIFERLQKNNKENTINQLRVVLEAVNTDMKVIPDLRIHAKADTIIRYPIASFIEVPCDHFTLYTNPAAVYTPIVKWLADRL